MEESLRDILDEEEYNLFKRYEKECEEGIHGFYDADEYGVIAEALILNGEWERARTLLKEARKRYPESVELDLKQAELYMETGEDGKAMRLLDKVEEVEPYLFDVYLLKAHLLKDALRFEEAEESVRKAEESGADPMDIYFCLAGIKAGMGLPDEAWEQLRLFFECDDEPTAQAANDFFTLCCSIGCLDKGMEYIREKALANPFCPLYWKLLSELAEEKRDYKEAIEAAEYAIAAAPDDKEAWMKKLALLEAAQEQGSETSPLAFYWEATKNIEDPGVLAAIYCRIAQEYELSGDYDKAEDCYHKAVGHSETHRYCLFRMGILYHYRMDWDKGMNLLNQALSADDPTDRACENTGLIYRGLARNALYRGDADSMLHYARLAHEIDPVNGLHLYSLCVDALRMKVCDEALTYIQTLDTEDNYRALLAKAALEWGKGDMEAAYTDFARSFLIDELRCDADIRFHRIYEADPEVLALRNAMEAPYKEDPSRLQDEKALDEFFGPLL